MGQIKRRLEENQIKTTSGKSVWSKSVIQEMLCNEKYMGDCMLQKYFIEDFLTGKKARNTGQRDKVVYRCATRIEKGREACKESPTIEEEWIKTEIGKKVCGGEYDEEVVKKKVNRVLVRKDGGLKILFI